MRKNNRPHDSSVGVLLLLLCLLSIHILCCTFDSGVMNDKLENYLGSMVCSNNLTAFQKITLGISVSVNSESFEGLTAVPGIGPKTADSIIRERTRKNGFKNIEELKSVGGIGHWLYKKVSPYLVL